MKLFLDDERFPPGDGAGWTIVRSYAEAVAWVEANGFPDHVSFDNDLGPGQPEGWQFAQWLIDRDLDRGDMPAGFDFAVHSQNPVAAENISARLGNYLQHRAGSKDFGDIQRAVARRIAGLREEVGPVSLQGPKPA